MSGVAPGFRLLGAPAALSSAPGMPLARIALSLGLPVDLTPVQLVERLATVRDLPPIPPKVVSRDQAACKQNILTGDDATLDRFPVPRVHEQDGGRYPNTWGVIIVRTPDCAWTNWSISRIMMINGKHMTGLIMPTQHIGRVWAEWVKIGKPMPYALVQGGDPAIPFVGGIPITYGGDEAGFTGALYGEPIEVVEAEMSDLHVPASAEIVIEGHLSTERTAEEGGEFAGYIPSATALQPVYSVECITYRDDPIWPVVPEGRPVDEFHTVTGAGIAAESLHDLRASGLPITTVWSSLIAANHWLAVTVPANWRDLLPGVDSQELTHRIGKTLQDRVVSANRLWLCTHVFVLDDDIDPANETELVWAIATRLHPVQRQEVWTGPILRIFGGYLDIEKAAGIGPVVVHDGFQPAPAACRKAPSRRPIRITSGSSSSTIGARIEAGERARPGPAALAASRPCRPGAAQPRGHVADDPRPGGERRARTDPVACDLLRPARLGRADRLGGRMGQRAGDRRHQRPGHLYRRPGRGMEAGHRGRA